MNTSSVIIAMSLLSMMGIFLGLLGMVFGDSANPRIVRIGNVMLILALVLVLVTAVIGFKFNIFQFSIRVEVVDPEKYPSMNQGFMHAGIGLQEDCSEGGEFTNQENTDYSGCKPTLKQILLYIVVVILLVCFVGFLYSLISPEERFWDMRNDS